MRKRRKSSILPLLLACLVPVGLFTFVVFSQVVYPFKLDDITSYQVLPTYHWDLLAYLAHDYQMWESRLLLTTLAVTLTHAIWLWRLLAIAAFSATAIVPVFYFKIKNRPLAILLTTLLVALIPLEYHFNTGAITTTSNYLFPFAAGLIAWLPIIRSLQGLAVPRTFYFLAFPFLILANNSEQIMVVSFLLLGLALGSNIIRRSRIGLLTRLIWLTETIGSFLFWHFSPGIAIRIKQEIWKQFPGFEQLSFFKKLQMGQSITSQYLFTKSLWLPALLLLALALASLYRRRFLTLIPLVLPAYLMIRPSQFTIFQANSTTVHDARVAADNQLLNTSYTAIFLAATALIVLAFILLKTYIPIFILGVGYATSLMLGFSPTIVPSQGRTQLYLLYACAYAILYLTMICTTDKIKLIKNGGNNHGSSSLFERKK